MRSLRRPAAALLATALLLTAACSSGGEDEPAAGAAGSAPATPTRTGPAPSADPELLARPEVRAIEAWAAAYARAVNQGDRSFAPAAQLVTPAVRAWMERHARLEWGRYFPGPLPVTPLGVRAADATHRDVESCVMVSGWTRESPSVRRTRSREVVGMAFRMTSVGGPWRVERITSAAVDCSGVVPRARPW